MKIGIIGAGSFGMALGRHLVLNKNDVKIWGYTKEEKDDLNNHRHSKYLPEITFPENLKASNILKEVVEDRDIIIHVTPSKAFKETLKKYKKYIKKQKILICSKGFDKKTGKTLEEILTEELPNIKYGVLSGPSHAEELGKDLETLLVCASKDEEVINETVKIFDREKIRIYGSKDVIGVALGGALKNIIAVAAGIIVGLNMGDNTLTAVITRGLVELSRFSEKLGADPKTIYGLSGLGDLIVTTLSEHSRNRRAGKLIARGYTKKEIEKELGMVVEGLDNIEVVYKMSKKLEIETPITDAVYEVLHGKIKPKEISKMLMTRTNKYE